VFLTGLGSVTAYNSVLVRSRVDGQILKLDFSEGQEVHAGDILVEIDPKPLKALLSQAQAGMAKDQAQLANARLDLTRATQLQSTGAVTRQQLDAARALVDQLDASTKVDEAVIDAAEVQLAYTTIRTPIDGRVGTRLIDVGNLVRAGDASGIVTVNQIKPIFVAFDLPSDSLPRIRAKMKAGDLSVTAVDNHGKDLATGRLTVVDNHVDAATATVRYKADFENADEVLWPGQFVSVRLQLDVRQNAITVGGDRARTRWRFRLHCRSEPYRQQAPGRDRPGQWRRDGGRRGPSARRAGGHRWAISRAGGDGGEHSSCIGGTIGSEQLSREEPRA